jgi:hypothetical protein
MFRSSDPGSRLASARRARGMSVVVAGTVALGLLPLGGPVASAASPSSVSSSVTAASTRVVAVGGLATQGRLAAAAVPSLAAVVFPDYTYEMSFRIKSTPLSPAQFFTRVRSNFVALFPIPGARALELGREMTLRPPGVPFPLYVERLPDNGWTFRALRGHPDWPNGYIDFRFNKVGPNMYLNIHGFIPPSSVGGRCFSFIPCRFVYLKVAHDTWTRFAGNLTRV